MSNLSNNQLDLTAHDETPQGMWPEEKILSLVTLLVGSAAFDFKQISTQAEWQELGIFRNENYSLRNSYMLTELDANGLDFYDKQSLVYGAWRKNELLGSVRLCPYPFELSQFMEQTSIQQFLGNHHQTNSLEWSRLIISNKNNASGLLSALIVYAGMNILTTTTYKEYFGYSTPPIRRLFAKFVLDQEELEFTIPRRGEHKYILFKGNFRQSFNKLRRINFHL